ncbi:MAG TPA: CHASE2 domain-containing protein, partial [Gammaproteobacteria bacterium]
MYKGKLYPVLLGLVMLVASIWMQHTKLATIRQFIDRIDAIAYDLRLRTFLDDAAKDPRIVIVDIDEQSLRSEGQWPWPRDRIAKLVDNLFSVYGVSVVGFDVVFAEKERNIIADAIKKLERERVGETTLQDLRKHINHFDNNRILAAALHDRPVVLGYMFHDRDNEPPVGQLPPPLTTSADEIAEQLTIQEEISYTAPIEILTEKSAGTGYFSVLPDDDGNIRRASLVTRYQGRFYPSLALETTRVFLDEQVDIHVSQEENLYVADRITLGNLVIPTDKEARVLVPYIGKEKSFNYVSAADVINGSADAELLAGTIVLVGTTAGGLFDLRSTPVGSVYPGVEVHANIIAGILDGQFPAEPSWARGFNFVLMMVMGVGLTLLLPRLSPVLLVTIPVAVGALLISGNFYAWAGYGLSLPVATAFFL